MIVTFLLLATPAPIIPKIADNESARETPEIVVEGSRIDEPAGLIVAPAPVRTALPPTALDVLETVPDIRAVSTGGPGGTSFVSIRGAEPNFAQILIEGVRVSNPSSSQGGGFDFAQLDPALIESIAVVPASRSAIYGSDALSGVISIRLPDPRRAGITAGASIAGDTAQGYAVSGRIGSGWDSGGMLIAASQGDTGELAEGSSIERRQAMLRLVQDLGSWDLSAFGLLGDTRRSTFPESSGGPLLAVNRAKERRDTRFLATGLALVAPQSAAVRPALRLGYYDDNVKADTPAVFPGVFAAIPALTSDTDYDRLQATGDVRFRLAPTLDLLVGADFQTEHARSTGTIDLGFPLPTAFDIKREQLSAFAEGAWRPVAGLKLSLASRTDWLRDRSNTSTQGSIEYSPPGTGLTLFAGYAEGFRLPSLFALAYPLTANPNLRPERSVGWEGGVRWEGRSAHLRASMFINDYTDLIDFDPVLFTTVNRAATTIRGASISGDGRIWTQVEWDGSFTLLDFDSAVPLRSRPDWLGHARVAWLASENLRLGAAATFNSDFLETSVPTGVIELDGHVALDLFADWHASEAITLSLSLRNATNADWQDAVGFPAPGRVLRAQVGFAF